MEEGFAGDAGIGGFRGRTVCANAALQIPNLSERRVLSTCAQQIAKRTAVDTAVAALVKELECFAVVCRGLIAVIHCCSLLFLKRGKVECVRGVMSKSKRYGGACVCSGDTK